MTVKYTLPRFPNHKWVFYFIQIGPNIHSELCRFGRLNCVTRTSLKVPHEAYRRFLIIQPAPIYPTYECTSRCLYKHTRTHILNTELVSIEVLPRLTRPACRCCVIRQIGKENLKQYLNMNSNQRRRGIRRFDGSPSRIAHTVFAIPSLPYTHMHTLKYTWTRRWLACYISAPGPAPTTSHLCLGRRAILGTSNNNSIRCCIDGDKGH